MLVGEPEHGQDDAFELLSAAVSGVSTNTIQGTAGTTEDMIKYSRNYALLLAKGGAGSIGSGAVVHRDGKRGDYQI